MEWAAKSDTVGFHWNAFLGCLAVAVLTSVDPVAGQRIEISGYYENTLQIDYTDETNGRLLDASKLRLDFVSPLARGLEVRGNVNFIISLGSISRELDPYLPHAVARQLQTVGVPDTFSLDRARLFIDNLFLTWTTGPIRLRAGKQQLSWGPAYGFNPTDLFHRKNLLDPTYEKEGVTAFRADYRWGIGGELSFIAASNEDLSHPGYALRLATHVSAIGYDLAITAHQVDDSTGLDPVTLTPFIQRRRAQSVELSGELFALGVWLEGNYNEMESETDFARVAFGLDYTLDDGTYLMAEALYNGRAEAHAPYPAHHWLANVYYGEPVGRWWILAAARRDVSDLVMGSLYLFASPDGSVVLNPRIDASISQNADLVVFGALTFGNEDGAFPPGLYSVIARATVYF